MTDERTQVKQSWDCGWESHRQAQLERLARLPLADKLEWLEQAHVVVLHLQDSRERGAATTARPSQ